MTNDEAKLLYMEYLYNELGEGQKSELTAYLDAHPDLKKELEDLHEVRNVLSRYPDEKPETQMIMIPAKPSGFRAYWQHFLQFFIPQNEVLRTVYAIAVCLILIISIGALFDMQVNYNESGFKIAFGAQELVPEEAISPEQLTYLIEQVKKENALMMAEFIQAAQEQQNQNIETAFAEFAQYMEQRRLSDLQLISSDLSTLQASYYTKFSETDRVLGEIIQTVQEN